MKFALLALILLSPAALVAQNPSPKIQASFYAFDYAPGHETVDVQSSAEGFESVRLSKANIVGPVSSLVTEGMLRLHAKPVTVGGKITHPVLSTTKLPAGIKQALVVLFPNSKDAAEPYRSIVFEHDLKDFPLGVYRMINLSAYPFRGAIGRDYTESKPGGMANLQPKGDPGSVVPVRFEYFAKDRWNLLTETRCAIRNDRRWLTCIYEDPTTGRMNIRSIPDRTSPPAVATPTN